MLSQSFGDRLVRIFKDCMSATILIVDDDPVQRRLLEGAVAKFGHEPVAVDSGAAALDVLGGRRGQDVRVMVLDLLMPGMDGLEVLERMRAEAIDIPVVVQTAKGSIDTVVAAMRAGAFDFVVKPASPERLRTAIANAMKLEAVEGEVRQRREKAARPLSFKDIVTNSPAMARVMRLAEKAAASDIPVLIEGESGVGKELIAQAIRTASRRRSKPFVTVNCGAIPDNLVESILFGHEKGAFTGATEKHTGKFVEAHGGTLFLDEIGDLPLDVQVKLLRAVQDGEVDPVGARASSKVDIRLISATHRDLLQQARDGKFRQDLFYRLNVFPIMVPPLRDRREDIPLLVRHFIARFADGTRKIHGISTRALEMLQAYDWPGNIRQLENAVFRAVVLCEGDVLDVEEFPQISAQLDAFRPDDLMADDAPAAPARTEKAAIPVPGEQPEIRHHFGILPILDERGNVRRLADVENDLIRAAIEHYDGRMSEVARRLGIGRSTLYRKLKEMGIDPVEKRPERLAS